MVDIKDPFLFKYKTQFGLYSKPAIGVKEVFFVSKTGLLYSINKFNGNPLWRYQINSTGATSPVVINEGENELIFVGGVYSFYNDLSSLIVTKPIKLWYNDIASTMSKTPSCVVCTKTHNYLYIGTEQGQIARLNCTNGNIIWSKDLSGIDTSHIIHNNNIVFVGTQSSDKKVLFKKKGYIYSLNGTNGNIIWKFAPSPLSSFLSIHSPVFVLNDLNDIIENNSKRLILAAGLSPEKYFVYALNFSTGEIVWDFKIKHRLNQPVIDYYNNKKGYSQCYVTSLDGNIYSLSSNNGTLLWIFKTIAAISNYPVIGKNGSNVIYIGNSKGVVYAVDTIYGSLIWSYETPSNGFFFASPSISLQDNIIYFPSRDGNLYAFNGSFRYADPTSSPSYSPISSPTYSPTNMLDYINGDKNNNESDKIFLYILCLFIFVFFIFLFIKMFKYVSYKLQIIKRKYRRKNSFDIENESSNLLSNDNYDSDKQMNYFCILRNIFILKCQNFYDYLSNFIANMPYIPKRNNNLQKLNSLNIINANSINHINQRITNIDNSFDDFLDIEIYSSNNVSCIDEI